MLGPPLQGKVQTLASQPGGGCAVHFNYQFWLKSHMALALFIYLYLDEDSESLIKVIIIADSVRRGSWMSDRLCVQRLHRKWHTGMDID